MRTLLLRCPRCGGALPALDGDRAFACGVCRIAFEPGEGGLEERSVVVLAPELAARRHVWLPFWRIRLAPDVRGGDAAELAREVFFGRAAWVRAFSLTNGFYLGDPSVGLTEAGLEPSPSDRPLLCLGAKVPSSAAARIAEWVLLGLVDRQRDITGLELRSALLEGVLAMVPFALEGEELAIAVGPAARFARPRLPDLAAILARAEVAA